VEFKKVNLNYVNEAVTLAILEYEREGIKCGQLIRDNYKEKLQGLIENLFESRYGVMALKEGELIGYLSFHGPWNGFFGEVKGAFSPLGGSAVAGENRNKTASLLFQKVSEELINDEISSIVVCLYAHDESRIFVAKENNEIIGYIEVSDEGEILLGLELDFLFHGS
jgi:hypothetical protein